VKVKIKEIGKVITGRTPPTQENSYWNSNDVPFVKPDDFKNDVATLDKYNTFISFDGLRKANKIPPHSVLVTCIGTIGKVVVTNRELATNQQINAIVPNDKIDARYLMYQILEKRAYLNHIANAPVVPIINKTNFENIEINLPSLSKQKEIAQTLDKVSELIELRKASIEKLDKLAQSIFIDMFGDPVENPKKLKEEKLGNLGNWKSGGTPSRTNKEYFKGEINWFTAGELNTLYVDNSIEKITDIAVKESSAKLFKKNTLLIGMYDTAAFKMSILKKDSTSNQAITNIEHEKNKVDVLWLFYALQLKKGVYLNSRRGVRQQNLSLTKIKNFTIILPDIKEQKKFVQTIEKIEAQKSLYEAELTKLKAAFDALMAQSFEG
jgi:type I restriction enzyme S subunit